jgi:hypothetical protein
MNGNPTESHPAQNSPDEIQNRSNRKKAPEDAASSELSIGGYR